MHPKPGASRSSQRPDTLLTPTTEDELAEAIGSAEEPLSIRGGGTQDVSVEGTPLTTSGISGINIYEPGALTIVANAGTPVSEVEAALAAENQMLAFEPTDFRALLGTTGEPTIGGVVATNTSGPRRVQAGACRDFLLGVRLVDGSGAIIKNGGRVMKNVTGYDLARLQCGAWGTLGVLTEVGLKVLPKPETANSLLITGLGLDQAVAAMSAALTSPFEVSGAAHTMSGLDGEPVTMIRLEGFEESVKYRAGKLKERLASFGEVSIETRQDGPESVTAGWRWLRDVETFADRSAVWRLSMKSTEVVRMFDSIRQDHACDILLDWGGGRIWVASKDNSAELHHALQSGVRDVGGHATLVKGSEELRQQVSRCQPEAEPLAKLAAGLRQKFDPRGILNPGLMG